MKTIERIRLLTHLNLNNNLSSIIQLSSNIHRGWKELILVKVLFMKLCPLQNLGIHNIQIQNISNKCHRHLRKTENLLSYDIQGRWDVLVFFSIDLSLRKIEGCPSTPIYLEKVNEIWNYPLNASTKALSSSSASGVVPWSWPSISRRDAVWLSIVALVSLILATISVKGSTSSSSKVST